MKQVHTIPGKILVKQAPTEEKTKSGIYIPTAEPPNSGTVVVVGADTQRAKMVLEVGDEVMFNMGMGTEYEITREDLSIEPGKYLLLDQSQVLQYTKK